MFKFKKKEIKQIKNLKKQKIPSQEDIEKKNKELEKKEKSFQKKFFKINKN